MTVSAADTTTGSEHIINGDFEYPGAKAFNFAHTKDLTVGQDWTGVERNSGQYLDLMNAAWKWRKTNGSFDKTKFGWDSTETDDPNATSAQRKANEVELQYDLNGNIYAELCASQAGTAIYQKIATTPGVAYTVSLNHASLTNAYDDSMRVVMIAKDGSRTIVPMTRTTSNKAGDPVDETSETITTHATNTSDRDHTGQWATYQGTYIATSDTTTFTFESVGSRKADFGNLLDDVSFKTAYPLTYNGNGNTGGNTPQQKNQAKQ